MKKRTLIILIIVLVPIIYLGITTVKYVLTLKNESEPLEHKLLLNNESGLIKHIESISSDHSNTFSAYLYDDNKYGILVFKRPYKKQDILSKINFINEDRKESSGRPYTGSIFTDYLNYSFDLTDKIDSLNVFIGKFSNDYIESWTESKVYISFPIENTLAIDFNNNDFIDLQVNKNQSINKEYNELMILRDNSYLYFIYLKPFKENLDKMLILESIVDNGNRSN